LTASFRKTPLPENIFFYAYAVLYSNTYREKYAEFLKADFPRIPFTTNYKLFSKLSDYGQQLVDWHLLHSKNLDSLAAKVQGKGSNKIEEIWHEKTHVYINEDRYFESVPQDVWEYQVGGYQVCEKWLKDRKGKTMSLEDIKQYCWIITALKKTMDIQDKIDGLYADVEKELVDFAE
jgi:predicted helicase